MSAARDEIIARIRGIDRDPAPRVEKRYRRTGELDVDARTALFVSRIADYRATVSVIPPHEVANAAGTAALGSGATRLAVPPGLPPAWRPENLDLVEDHGMSAHELDALGGTITGCTVAIAETGTLVLTASPAEGRRALSLVPDLHICIVEASQIVELVTEATAILDEPVARHRRPVTFISGPSATSDIELSRVEGVHGPRTLVVLVVSEDGAAT